MGGDSGGSDREQITDVLVRYATFPPGPSPLGTLSRRDAVELISQGAAALRD